MSIFHNLNKGTYLKKKKEGCLQSPLKTQQNYECQSVGLVHTLL